MLVVPHQLGLDYHIPLHTPYCLLCRYLIRPGETIAAVIGDLEWQSYLAYTFGFSFPLVTQNELYTTVYEKSGSKSYQWLLCRESDCYNCKELQGASIYHIDCLHTVSRAASSKRPTLQNIWTIASWTESLRRYQAPPDVENGIALKDTSFEDHESILARLCGMPQELRDAIVGLCPESPAWRFVSALNRWRTFQTLLDPDLETQVVSIDALKSWSRYKGPVAGNGGNDRVMIQLDGLGVSRLDYANDSPSPPTTASRTQNVWYIAEQASNMRAARIEIKGSFMRIHNLQSFHFWDTPNPPTPTCTRWNCNPTERLRIRCVSVENITGLTVFCQSGSVRWIYPHRDESFFDNYAYPHDTSPPLAKIVSSVTESGPLTAIFFPFAKGERIRSIGVRRCDPNHHAIPDTLLVTTTTGRFQLFGKYVCPLRSEVHFQKLSGDGMATNLLFQDADFPFQSVSFFAAASASVDTNLSEVPSQLTQTRGFSWISSFSYLSVVSSRNIQQIWLFRRQVPAGTPRRERVCRGMMLQYEDGTLAAAGVCRREPDIDVHVAMLPTLLLYKISHDVGGLAVECATREVGQDVIIGDEEGWHSIDLSSREELRWWFDDWRTIWISSPYVLT